MSNYVKGCSCDSCRRGMHTKYGGFLVRKVIRRIRHQTKVALHRGQEPPKTIGRGHTD